MKVRWVTEDSGEAEVEVSLEATVAAEEVEEGGSRELETGSVRTRESGFCDFPSSYK